MDRTTIKATGLLAAMLMLAVAIPLGVAAKEGDAASAGASPAVQWMTEAMGTSPKKPLFRAQTKFESLPREEPWSSSMEKEFRAFFGGPSNLSVFHVECRSLLCEVLLEGDHAANADRRWWDAMFELKRKEWYRTHFRKDTGSTLLFVQHRDRLKQKDEKLKWGAYWLFLRRDSRTDALNDAELDEQSLLPKPGGH